jgi:hypothetical protein
MRTVGSPDAARVGKKARTHVALVRCSKTASMVASSPRLQLMRRIGCMGIDLCVRSTPYGWS